MQDDATSQSMSRLKELLFEPESQALVELRQRIELLAQADQRISQDLTARLLQLTASAEAERVELKRQLAALADESKSGHADLARRLEALFERAGTSDRFKASVAAILDGALREAEVSHHSEMSQAVAPLIVNTIKTEIRNSQDELAEALYPHMGRMVKAYIASAMKDLSDQLNRRLEANPVMLRIRSFTTGRPVSELAMAEMMRLEVEELYLIRRGTGELVGRWPTATAASNRDHVLGGTLSAINEFAADAFDGEAVSLRRVDLGSAQIYLRASPLYLLAAKCSGSAPPAVEQVIDDSFLTAIDGHRGRLLADGKVSADVSGRLLGDVSRMIEEKVAARQAELAIPSLGFAPLKWAAAIVILPLLGWLGWSLWLDYGTARTRSIAETAIAETGDAGRYPIRLDVARGGGALTMSGLVPNGAARSAIGTRVSAALPGVEVAERLAVLPDSATELSRQIAEIKQGVTGLEGRVGNVGREVQAVAGEAAGVRRDLTSMEADLAQLAVRRALMRAVSRLDQAIPDLSRLSGELASTADQVVVKRVPLTGSQIVGDMRARLTGPASGDALSGALEGWRRQLSAHAGSLAGLIGQRTSVEAAAVEAAVRAAQGPAEAAEEVAAGVERLAAVVVAVQQANAVLRSLPEPTAREKLARFIGEHAVFFGNNTDFRDPAASEQILDQLAGHLRATDVLLRVVGYTDERGGSQRNSPLSQGRADRVRDGLVQRGVPRERLVALGRLNAIDISPTVGTDSANRRVEFEIGFKGEAGFSAIGERVP